jgi:hypothetical protein
MSSARKFKIQHVCLLISLFHAATNTVRFFYAKTVAQAKKKGQQQINDCGMRCLQKVGHEPQDLLDDWPI